MRELTRILEAYHSTDFSKQKAALATVVKVIGSSYRSPGARMYITDDGHWEGSISGGCLEGDALRKSRKVMQDRIPQVVVYDTSEENNSLGVGLGCEGIIYVLLVPLEEGCDVMNQLKWIDCQENELAMATIVSADEQTGFVPGDQFMLDTSENPGFRVEIRDGLQKTLASKESFFLKHELSDGLVEVFYELFEPAINLLIFGGGYDAKPLAKLAHLVGCEVSVVDDCVAHLIPASFPNTSMISCTPEAIEEYVTIRSFSAAVVMYHSYKQDYKALKALLETDIAYIGILGPRKKGEKMLQQLMNEENELKDYDFQRIHYPVGLDIGADTPEEIALSIVAEIKAFFSGREGGGLRNRTESIHKKGDTGEVFKQAFKREHNELIGEVE